MTRRTTETGRWARAQHALTLTLALTLARARGQADEPTVTRPLSALHARVTAAQAVKLNREQGEGVQKLYLNDNQISDQGIAFIADALKNNQTVEELYLQYTAIGDAGLQHLLQMLSKNSTLRRLECGCCGITEKGAQEVLKALGPGGYAASNKSLRILGLHGNADEIEDDLPEIYKILGSRK